MKALVIGGGIAGPVAAMALQKVGIDSTIYEAFPTSSGNAGTFLTFAGNGMNALSAIGADEAVRRKSFPTPRLVLRSGTGKLLGEVTMGSADGDTAARTMRRGDLYQALHEEAAARGVSVEYGRRLVDARIGGESVTVSFEDGSSASGDFLIGADGVRSVTRRLIDPNAPAARYVPVLNIGGYSAGVDVEGEPGAFYMTFGKKCFFGYVKAPNGEVWWFANPPRREEPKWEELSAVESDEWIEQLIELFSGDGGPAVEIIKATTNRLQAWKTHDLPRVPHWHNERMVIIGDAAHAVAPSSGQGASMAVEDAVLLAKCLRDLTFEDAFPAFVGLRRDRVEAIVAHGARSSNDKAAGPVGRVIRDLVMPFAIKRFASPESQEWMYGYRIDWDEKVTPSRKVA